MKSRAVESWAFHEGLGKWASAASLPDFSAGRRARLSRLRRLDRVVRRRFEKLAAATGVDAHIVALKY